MQTLHTTSHLKNCKQLFEIAIKKSKWINSLSFVEYNELMNRYAHQIKLCPFACIASWLIRDITLCNICHFIIVRLNIAVCKLYNINKQKPMTAPKFSN